VEQAAFALKLSDEGEVIILVGGPHQSRANASACGEMCRIMREVDYGRGGTGL
jgi:hypothetical protein